MTNNIDKIFKEKLDSYSSSVSPGLWDGISATMVRDSRRRIMMLALLIFVVIASAILLYFAIDHDPSTGKPDVLIAKGN